ncbi:MAG: ATP-binding protein [Ignavibacteriales bacterium]|nr:ATP-binding protein [Ignavibacteriales bacterium]
MTTLSKKISKTIESRTDHLLEVREFVLEAARQFGFSEEEASKIVLAVDEACTNVIKHAYQNAPDKIIQVEISRDKDAFQVSILDEGRSFNPTALKTPDLKQHLAHFRRGGLGVYLMRTLMDKVEYNFAPGRKNEVRLIKFLTPGESGSRS